VSEEARLRVVIADDERPARSLLSAILRSYDDVEVVAEAADGAQCVELIEALSPDLALLDLQMPEIDGLGVVRLLKKDKTPLIAFVTAYDEFAVRAFDINAVDYVLKPVEPARIRQTLNRAMDRLERKSLDASDATRVRAAALYYAAHSPTSFLRRIPLRKRDDIVLVETDKIASVVANGELLNITTYGGERFTITYRLKDLEARLDPAQFVRISRGTLLAIAAISKITPMPGGNFQVALHGGATHQVSRLRGRVIREQLLKI
jgi:two-component system LytT family response regulator